MGTPIANRRQGELEAVIGFFVNTLVMRTDLSADPSFVQVLQQVREVALGAYAHQDIPFEKVVEELEPERDLSRSPLFQVMFILQHPAQELGELVGLSIKPLVVESSTSKFDLTLSVEETEQGLHCSLEYNTDLFEAQTIRRLLGHWQTLLEGIVQSPQAHLSDLPLLTAAQREQLLVQWNATQADYPQGVCVHQLFEQQVERTPDAVALVFEDQLLTYTELNRRANQLAHHLQGLGVGPEMLVGICMQRSIDMIIGLLAVLKAGGAYVPLDPTYPKEWLALMIEDAHISVLLTTGYLLDDMPEIEHIVCLDMDWEVLAHSNGETPAVCNVLPMNLAYVLYTSGSTGKPKGVMISHEGLVHYVNWASERYEVQAGAGTLLHTSLAFDLTVTSLFPSLVVGRSVWLIAQDSGVEGLANALCTGADFSLVKLTPAHLDLLNQLLTPGELRERTRLLILGGEALRAKTLEAWRLHTRTTRFINEYGPTETVVGCCIYEVPPQDLGRRNVPIGRPIANTQMYLLDWQMQPVPWGVVGEVYIGGIGLGRGYLDRADLTAERWVPHPFSSEPGARLYKTGDLARYCSNGAIEFVGRVDYQVKVRGYRIELGEIEAVLSEHPAIQDCVVLAREDELANKRLVAYLVVHQAQTLTVSDVRSYLRDRLPASMIPSACVVLDALPLTPNGKVDRQALPAPEEVQEAEPAGPQEARTLMEELLVGIWSQVLGRRQVGIDDNFFELGGHSLLATRLMAQVRAMLEVEVPLRTVFEAPTVAALAQRVEQRVRQSQGSHLPALEARERPEEIPLSFAQQRLWFLDQLEPSSTAYLIPSALRFQGELTVEMVQRSLEQLVQRHESLRTTFVLQGEQPVQVIHPPELCVVPVIDLQGLLPEHREHQVKEVLQQEAEQPCDLERGPLLRMALLRLEPQEHVLLLTLHHIITDGWSSQIVMHELSTLYQTQVSGQPSPLSALPIQYADYALWQRAWLQGEVLTEQLAYWRKRLAGILPLALPTDHPRPAVQTYRGALQSLLLPQRLLEALQVLSRQEQVTLFMLLLAAWQVLLARYSGQSDISVGTPIANRRQGELEAVIGFFVNTLVMRTDLSADPSFVQVLQRVREVALGAYTHQDIPFEKVVEELEPERDLSRSPLFQVMFILQHPAQELGELVGLSIKPLVVESSTSKFDLTLSLRRQSKELHCTLRVQHGSL